MSNSTVTLIPKLPSVLASSTSNASPGSGGGPGKAAKLILSDAFSGEEGSLRKRKRQEDFPLEPNELSVETNTFQEKKKKISRARY